MTCPAYDLPKQTLLSTISSLSERRSLFFSNPDSDFTRVKKISFDQTILFPIIAGKENTATELIDFFNEGKIPFPSAMIQRRNQIKPEAFAKVHGTKVVNLRFLAHFLYKIYNIIRKLYQLTDS